MWGLSPYETAFVVCAFLFQIILIIHFALRRWRFALALRYGWAVYAVSVPAGVVSGLMMLNGQPWSLWLGGFIYLVWAAYGFTVEYVRGIKWRSPVHWPVFLPYVGLYLATVMLYWWPLGMIWRPLWYGYGLLFVVSTVLNVTSHQAPPSQPHSI